MTGCKPRKYSSGQVMPLTVILIGIIALSAIFLYNTNIVVTQRIKLQNTADAAAYSSATMDARYLNFMAYSNRAMIADHVITAQIVGIASEGRMLKKMTAQLSDYLSWIPYYGEYISIVAEVLDYFSMGLDYAADFEVPALNVVTNIISKAQQAFKSAYPIASAALISKVVAANDKDACIDVSVTAGRVVALSNFLEQYSPDNADSGEDKKRVNEFYDATMASRNIFSSARSGDLTGPALDAINNTPFTNIKFKVLKYGGTDMSNGDAGPSGASKYKTWAAMDTISIWTKVRKWHGLKLKWSGWKTEVPLGAGAGTGGESYDFDQDTNKKLYGDGAWRNSWSASIYGGEKYENDNYDGLLPFIDLKKTGRVDSAPVVYVAVKKSENKISTNRTLGVASGSIDISEKGSYRKGTQFNVAKGSAYFKRPQDIESALRSTTGNKREFGNLYNPFWLPRLDSATTTELQALLAAALVD